MVFPRPTPHMLWSPDFLYWFEVYSIESSKKIRIFLESLELQKVISQSKWFIYNYKLVPPIHCMHAQEGTDLFYAIGTIFRSQTKSTSPPIWKITIILPPSSSFFWYHSICCLRHSSLSKLFGSYRINLRVNPTWLQMTFGTQLIDTWFWIWKASFN